MRMIQQKMESVPSTSPAQVPLWTHSLSRCGIDDFESLKFTGFGFVDQVSLNTLTCSSRKLINDVATTVAGYE